ncbi:MAG TPA: septum formation initiator family protein [Candidatus Binatia bacterium]|jgi:cell division protein FtsB
MPLRLTLPHRWPVYLLGSLIVLLSLVTIVGERGALHLWRLRGEKSRLDEQNYRLQKENESLRQRVHRIRNDPDYLEKLAREELNMVRPGEVVYRFQSPAEGAPRRDANETVSQSRPAAARKGPR